MIRVPSRESVHGRAGFHVKSVGILRTAAGRYPISKAEEEAAESLAKPDTHDRKSVGKGV